MTRIVSEAAIVIALLFAFVCAAFAVVHSGRTGRVTLLAWALLAIGGLYGVGWAFLIFVTQEGGNPVWAEAISPFVSMFALHTACAFVMAASICGGWYGIAPLIRRAPKAPLSAYAQEVAPWVASFWLMFALAIGFQWLYVQAYGGFFGLLDFSMLIRSAVFEVDNPWSFLQPFAGLTFVAALGFFGLLLSGRRTLGTRIGLALSFAFGLYVLYSRLGRIGFLVFLLAFPLGFALCRVHDPLKIILIGAVGFVVILGGAFGVSVWLDIKSGNSFTEFAAREISFPFVSFFAQWSDGQHLSRGFSDFVMAPLFLLPSSWWTSWFETVDTINTALILGAKKGEFGVAGSIPVDLLTLGLMQAHIVGVPIVGAMFGALLRAIQALTDNIPLKGVRAALEGYIALKIAVLGIFYAQPNLVVAGNFPLLVAGLIIGSMLLTSRVRLRSRQ